jgi:hypothetical protein
MQESRCSLDDVLALYRNEHKVDVSQADVHLNGSHAPSTCRAPGAGIKHDE